VASKGCHAHGCNVLVRGSKDSQRSNRLGPRYDALAGEPDQNLQSQYWTAVRHASAGHCPSCYRRRCIKRCRRDGNNLSSSCAWYAERSCATDTLLDHWSYHNHLCGELCRGSIGIHERSTKISATSSDLKSCSDMASSGWQWYSVKKYSAKSLYMSK
jgi:hypothetical protein